MDSLMKTKLSSATPAQLETECLVVIALDRGSKDKTEVTLETTDDAVRKASEEVIASGELTGKSCEVTLLHHPAGLKAKRLLVLGGGQVQTFSGFELRRIAGTAVRALKSRGLRSFAFALPQNGLSADQAIKAVVEGGFVGNFDADTYRSDRKDQKIDELTLIINGDAGKLQVSTDVNGERRQHSATSDMLFDVPFATGGISIKPADGMEKMKYDMAGGAAMLGAMRAIALLKPKVKVIAVVCATENMPSGKAQKPGDIQIAMSGKSIEIINTDAEGRLVLADGLYYARQLGCTHLVDAATLTGAVVVALGYVNAGIFANDDKLYDRFQQAETKAGEKFWRLPLDDEYKEVIKSSIADIMNTGGRWGGAINAAMFLKEFAEETPWLHLDIAGTAWTEEAKPWIAKGPSGIAVRSLVEFVKDFSS